MKNLIRTPVVGLWLAVSGCVAVGPIVNEGLNEPEGRHLIIEGSVTQRCASLKPVSGATVALTSAATGQTLASATTDSLGHYRFTTRWAKGLEVALGSQHHAFDSSAPAAIDFALPCDDQGPFAR